MTDVPRKEAKQPSEAAHELLNWFLQLYRRGLVFFALVGVFAFTAIGWALERFLLGLDACVVPVRYSGVMFAVGVLTNLAAACLIYLGVREKFIREFHVLQNQSDQHILATKLAGVLNETYYSANGQLQQAMVDAVQRTLEAWEKSGIQEFELIDRPPWDEWIKKANTIDICVQGWETWAKDHESAWVDFFGRNGTVNLYLPNPNDKRVLTIITERMPPRKNQDQVFEIKNTYRKLKQYRDIANTGAINHRQLRRMNWYCAVRFDDDILLLSLYEHVRVQEQTGHPDSGPHIKSPSYKVPLQEQKHRQTYKWIKKEFEGLSLEANSTAIAHPTPDWD